MTFVLRQLEVERPEKLPQGAPTTDKKITERLSEKYVSALDEIQRLRSENAWLKSQLEAWQKRR